MQQILGVAIDSIYGVAYLACHAWLCPRSFVCSQAVNSLCFDMPFMANGSVLDYVKHHKVELLHTSEDTEAQGASCIPYPHRKKGFVTLTNILHLRCSMERRCCAD